MNETTQQNRLFDNKKLAALLIPLAVDQLLNSFMGTVDTLVVSNLGSAAISAVSLVDSINILIRLSLHWHQVEQLCVPITLDVEKRSMHRRQQDSWFSLRSYCRR